MNLGDAQTELAGRGFDYLAASRMTIMLNDAKNALEDQWPFPWLETTATGTAPLTITDLKQVLYVQDTTNDNELLGLPVAQIAVDGDDITRAGTPAYWWLDGTSTLNVWPVSTSVQLSVRYVRESVELSAVSDTPLIPARYHPLWVDLAVVQAYHDSDNFAGAQQLQGYVDSRMAKLVERYEQRNLQNGSYQTIRYMSDDW